MGAPAGAQGRNEGGVNGKLHAAPKRQPVRSDFYALVIKFLNMDIQVTQTVRCDSGTGLLLLERPTASAKGSRPRSGGAVVTKGIQSTPTRTQGRTQRKREPQTAKEEHAEERGLKAKTKNTREANGETNMEPTAASS